MEQTREVKLAYEIATALNDLKSIDWHIRLAKRWPEAVLKEQLADTLARTYLNNPAAHFNDAMQRYGKHPRN